MHMEHLYIGEGCELFVIYTSRDMIAHCIKHFTYEQLAFDGPYIDVIMHRSPLWISMLTTSSASGVYVVHVPLYRTCTTETPNRQPAPLVARRTSRHLLTLQSLNVSYQLAPSGGRMARDHFQQYHFLSTTCGSTSPSISRWRHDEASSCPKHMASRTKLLPNGMVISLVNMWGKLYG